MCRSQVRGALAISLMMMLPIVVCSAVNASLARDGQQYRVFGAPQSVLLFQLAIHFVLLIVSFEWLGKQSAIRILLTTVPLSVATFALAYAPFAYLVDTANTPTESQLSPLTAIVQGALQALMAAPMWLAVPLILLISADIIEKCVERGRRTTLA